MFIISSLGGGGAERKTALLASSLAERGHSVSVLILSPRTRDEYDLSSAVVRIVIPEVLQKDSQGASIGRRTTLERIRNFCRKIRCIRKQIKKYNPRHVISLGHPEGILASLCKRSRNHHLIWTTSSIKSPKSNDPRYRILFWLARMRKTQVITQTNEIEREYRQRGFTNLKTIPNPVYIPQQGTHASHAESCFRIIAVGRLIPEKSYETLIDALGILERSHTEWECKIVGKGPLQDDLEQKCRDLAIDSRVNFTGWSNDIRSLLGNSDVFVMTSLVEGQPNALLEAMSESLACVSTNFSGGAASTLLGTTGAGLVVPVGDAKGIYNAIETLMFNLELRKKLGIRARSITESFSIDKVTDHWIRELGMTGSGRP